ncbi:type II toxin-antitoxin system HicB family antitoxin [Paenibacillus sp. LS1]|uniref:type II toxin-antitoxin system HicB family antitoxin n=1 Tax=Paenibacillus sp. LS1 TaxID=2992120 RepID=UPI00222F4437|nr:type II toxin-antitoxin system HicB family antitoxin [Paenibacillus sp. LS1]MCW3796096.1 type II toxin-antitoxin system HicB family antitoxin [Paenibacillus sp. LS1]
MINTFIFPAVVEKGEDGGIGLYFPDVADTAVLAPDIQTAVKDAKNMLVDRILEMEHNNMEIPAPSDLDFIELNDPSDRVVFVEVFLPPYRDAAANKSVTVNCTVPQWLRDAGKDAELNFSQLLQNSVKDALGIK